MRRKIAPYSVKWRDEYTRGRRPSRTVLIEPGEEDGLLLLSVPLHKKVHRVTIRQQALMALVANHLTPPVPKVHPAAGELATAIAEDDDDEVGYGSLFKPVDLSKFKPLSFGKPSDDEIRRKQREILDRKRGQ